MSRNKRFCMATSIMLFLLSVSLGSTATQNNPNIATTAEGVPMLLNQSASATTVITAEDIRKSGIESIVDILRFVPGLNIQRDGEFGAPAFASINGVATNQLLVMLNGERVSIPSFNNGTDLSRFTVEDIERIEIVRGALSSLYGSEAIGGVINIITNQSSEKKNEVKLGYGSNGRIAQSLSINGRNGIGWKLNVGAPRFDGHRQNSSFDATKFGIGLDVPIFKDWELVLRQSRYEDKVGLPGPITRSLAGGPGMADPDDNQKTIRNKYSISTKHNVGKGLFNISGYQLQEDFDQLLTGHGNDSNLDATGTINASDFNYRYTSKAHDVVLGVELRNEKYESSDSIQNTSQSKEITNNAVYLQDRWIIDPNTHLVAGARVDDNSVAGNITSPRLALIRALPHGMKLRASYAEGFRTPGFVELYFTGTSGSGNPDLKPEKSRQYELSLNSQQGDDVFEMTAFANDVNDQIVWEIDQDTYLGTYENIDKTRQRGLEMSWQRKMSETGEIHCIIYIP